MAAVSKVNKQCSMLEDDKLGGTKKQGFAQVCPKETLTGRATVNTGDAADSTGTYIRAYGVVSSLQFSWPLRRHRSMLLSRIQRNSVPYEACRAGQRRLSPQ